MGGDIIMKMNNFKLIKYMLHLVKDKVYLIILAVLVGTIGYLASMSLTFFAGVTILNLFGYNILNLSLNVSITLLITSGFLRGLLRYIEQYLNHYMAFTLLAHIRNNIFKSLRNQGSKIFESSSLGELLSILSSDTESLEVFYAHTITPLFIAIATETVVLVLFGVLISYIFSLYALLIYLIIGAIIPIIFYLSNRNLGIKYRKELSDNENKYFDALYGVKEVLFFLHEEDEIKDLNESTKKLNSLNSALNKKANLFSALVNSLIMISNILIIIISVSLLNNHIILPLNMILAYMMLATSFGPVVALSNLPSNLTMSFASAKRIYKIENEKNNIKDGNQDFDFEKLEIKDVSFFYDDNKKEVLKDINLTIQKGEIISIQGKSGAGKSTLLKLLLHFEEADKGEILYNNINIKDISRESLSKNVTLFSQSTYLFKNTIRYNMKIGKSDASDEEIYNALKQAQIFDKIDSLPDKLDTIISDKADNFSTGEKQRLALARIFLHDSKLILLDEATSNIDSYNESLILKELNNIKKDKAIIIISHKKTALKIVDKVYTLKEGILCS